MKRKKSLGMEAVCFRNSFIKCDWSVYPASKAISTNLFVVFANSRAYWNWTICENALGETPILSVNFRPNCLLLRTTSWANSLIRMVPCVAIIWLITHEIQGSVSISLNSFHNISSASAFRLLYYLFI